MYHKLKLYKMKNIKVINPVLLKTPKDRSPIFFIHLTAHIWKGNAKNPQKIKAKNIVVKGTIDQIKKSDETKKRFLREFFNGDSATKKKVHDYDLSKIKIIHVEIIKILGYGTKCK